MRPELIYPSAFLNFVFFGAKGTKYSIIIIDSVLHFSPYATTEAFALLKQKRPEPDATVAVKVGVDASTEEGPAEGSFAPGPQSMLERMPGVTSKNIKRIMKGVTSLRV